MIFGEQKGRVYSLHPFFVKSMKHFSQIFRGQDIYKILDSKRIFLWADIVLKYETRLYWILFGGKKTN
jgi:hypothetical protein